MTSNEIIIFRMLVKAAEMNDVCPGNNVLAVAIGANSSSSASRIVSILERDGYIEVERTRRSRRVTICATGQTTKESGIPGYITKGDTLRDRFAEIVANGFTRKQACARMGFTQQRGQVIWNRIIRDLGWQAV